MKKIYLLSTFLFLVVCNSFSQVPGIQWQKCFGGGAGEMINGYDENYAYNAAQKVSMPLRGGGFLMGGNTLSYESGDVYGNHVFECDAGFCYSRMDVWIVKLDTAKEIIWQKCLGGKEYDYLNGLYENTDQSIIAIGLAGSVDGDVVANHGNGDAWVVKLDKNGNVIWKKCYGGSAWDVGYSIKPTSDGGYIFTGATASADGDVTANHGANDMWVVKIDSIGQIKWQRTYGGNGDEMGYVINTMPGGGFLIAGQTNSNNNGDVGATKGFNDFWLLNLDANGNIVSQKTYGTQDDETLSGLTLTRDGGSIILGAARPVPYNSNLGANSALIYKLDAGGNIEWQKYMGGSASDFFNDAKETPEGNIIITGKTASSDGDLSGINFGYSSAAWLVKLTSNGSFIWQRTLGGTDSDMGVNIHPISEDEMIMFGSTWSNDGNVSGNKGTTDLWLVKLSAVNTIKGIVYYDANRNGIKDANEQLIDGPIVKSEKPGIITKASSAIDGVFKNEVDTGNYITTLIKTSPYFTVSPSSKNSSFSSYYNEDSVGFALQPIAGKRDLSVSLFPLLPSRPGMTTLYKLLYKNQGTDTIANGTVRVIKSNRLTVLSTDPAYTLLKGDTLEWNYAGLKPWDNRIINLSFKVASPPLVNNADLLTSIATITPAAADLTPADDTSILTQTVIGSYDPNNKSENHAGVIKKSEVSKGGFLLYTISFQNTGTDTAFNIVVRDTLSNKLDWNSFEMINASNGYRLNINDGNICTWSFNNIKLVDSNRNEPASHGYITYRIKPKLALAAGDTVKNAAGIYFDFNFPVSTNTDKTIVEGSILPLTLLLFEATKNGETNLIQWHTSDEIDIRSFDVEKSRDGRTFFTAEKVVLPANGDSRNEYAWLDEKPEKAINFYRLKITNKDGSVSYSAIKLVNNFGTYSVTVYPNPAKNNLYLKIDSEKKTDVQIDITNQEGKTIISSKAILTIGSVYRNVNIASLAAGTYFVRVKTAKEQLIIKFYKL